MISGLRNRFLTLGAVFLLQALMFLSVRLEERIPANFALDSFPAELGPWKMDGEEMLDEPTRALLQPDLSFMRRYQHENSGTPAGLFVGYFKSTQANHPAPHSPTVCLPGAGWKNIYTQVLDLNNTRGRSFQLNEYVLQKGNQRLVVLYWYQNTQRTWAKEVLAKIYMLPDFYRQRRTDVALVRLTFLSDEYSYKRLLEEGKDIARHVEPALADLFVSSLKETIQ